MCSERRTYLASKILAMCALKQMLLNKMLYKHAQQDGSYVAPSSKMECEGKHNET